MYTDAEIDRAASAIAEARAQAAVVSLPPGLPPLERADAYRVQTRVNQLVMPAGARIAGFKVAGMQRSSGSNVAPGLVIAKPLCAPLWDHQVQGSEVTLDGRGRRLLGLETEICLRIGVGAKPGGGKTYEVVGTIAAFEIVEQRMATPIDSSHINLLIADSIANAGIVLGPETPGWPEGVLEDEATISRNGEQVMARRIGERLEDPRLALGVLCEALDEMGWVVEDGALLLTGLLTTELWLKPGDLGEGVIGRLGQVTASLAKG